MFGAQYYANTGMKVAATSFGLFLGQFTMWAFLVLWVNFYYISYYGKGGKKYVQHQETNKALSEKAQ
jgi:hypothetical protein